MVVAVPLSAPVSASQFLRQRPTAGAKAEVVATLSVRVPLTASVKVAVELVLLPMSMSPSHSLHWNSSTAAVKVEVAEIVAE